MDEDNAFGQKLSKTVNYPDFSKTFSYTYDNNGQKRSFSMPDGTTYSYTYEHNELRNIRIPGVGNISYPSYTMGRPDSMSSPGDTRSYSYDALARLDSLDSSTLDYSYTYDDVGNILTKQTEHGNYVYDYDDVYRLTSVDNPIQDDEAYTYDGVGNRETASGVSGSITHNANNELTVYGDISYNYDANGNMIRKSLGTTAILYSYDEANRLVKVEDEASGTVIAEYGYDPFGRRLWKDISGTRTYFFYADEGLVAEYDATGDEIRSYGYQPDSTWTADLLWLKEGGSYYWYQNDHLGTPQKLVDSNGTVVWSVWYNAFGEAEIQIETVTNNLRFPGQYEDDETGLHYNKHWYYNPKIGRYVRVDPLGITVDVNLFAYVKNRPTNYFDDSGLKIKGVQVVRGHVNDGIFSWDYQYHQEGCSVTIRIKLIDKTPPPYLNDPIIETWRRHPEKIIKRWEIGVEEKWSHKFACCDPDGFTIQGLCCKGSCVVTVDVQFVTSGEDAIVEVHHGWSRSYPGYPHLPDMLNWWTVDSGDIIAHEIGHHLGLKDEYPDTRAPNRYPVNTGTVMDSAIGSRVGPAVLRHFRGICRNIGKVSTTLRNPGLEPY